MNRNAFNNPPKKSIGQQVQPLILPLVTAVGAFGGFPDPPNMFKRVVKNKIVQYLLLFLLIWQGGGGQDWKLSAKVTAVVFVLITLINMFDKKKENFTENNNNMIKKAQNEARQKAARQKAARQKAKRDGNKN